MAVQADGKILLGGAFDTLQPNGAPSATPRNRIARVNADGTLDTGFDPSANSSVFSVAVQADGKILLGGLFSTLQPNGAVGATQRNKIARVNADGTLDTGFDPNSYGDVYGVALQADGKILLGGFSGGSPTSTSSLNNDAAIQSLSGTQVYSGGSRTYGTVLYRYAFARLNNDVATQSLGVLSPTQVLWQRGGAAPEVSQVTFELSTDSGTTWAPLPGTASRVGTTGNWQLTGLSLPASGQLRARGRTTAGYFNGSSGIVQQVAGFSGPGAAGWRWTQLTTTPNAADGARTGAAHSSWYLYYYKGTDSNIWCTYWTGAQWEQAQLTFDGDVDDWLSFGTGYNILCYKGTDNKLWELYWSGTPWVKVALGTNANVASDIVMDDGWNLIYHRGTDQRVWKTWWDGTQWAQESLGGAANVQGSLAVDGPNHYVYYQSTDNQLWCYYWSGTAWVQKQLSATPNVGGAVTADTGGLLAYYRSSADNSAWEVYWNGSTWVQAQIDDSAGMGTGNSMVPYGIYTTLYLNNNGQCFVEYWNGSRWGSVPLGNGGFGLTGGLSLHPGTNWVFARRSDGQVVVFYYQ